GDEAERCDVVDATTARGEQLGDADAHEIPLAVVDEDESPGGLLAGEDALGRQYVRAAGTGNRRVRQVVQPVRYPVRTGRNDDDLRPVFPDQLGPERYAGDDLDVPERREPALPPIDDARPEREPRKKGDECRIAAEVRRGVDEVH